jgi:integrase
VCAGTLGARSAVRYAATALVSARRASRSAGRSALRRPIAVPSVRSERFYHGSGVTASPTFGGGPETRTPLATKIEAGLSRKKVRDMVSVVSLIMKTAIAGGARRDNPAAGHMIPQRRSKLRQGDVLSMEQAHRLAAATRDPYKPAVWLMVLLGLRPAELCGLRVRSVDFVHGTIHVAETLNAVHSFPGHDDGIEVGPPKTEAGDRVLPVPAWLRDDLALMLAARAGRRGVPVDPAEHLFPAIKGTGPIRVADLRRWVIRPALTAAGLQPELRTYDLRHSHASLLIDLGANPLEVAHRMGHTDPAITLRVYGHLFAGAQEKLTTLLDELREQTKTIPPGNVVSLDERRTAR